MILPLQAQGVFRNAGSTAQYDGFERPRAVAPQFFLDRGLTELARCYYGYIRAGVPDLIARFFCGARPFTIGGLLLP